ncbi:unnamed protein product, partial [Rotaria sp. Silwood2]
MAVNNQARCECPPRYTGRRCETPIVATPSQTPSTVTLTSTTLSTITTPAITPPTSTLL